MKRILAALLVVATPVWAASPTGCGELCGRWQLDAALSTAVAPAVDSVLSSYKEPKARRAPRSQRSSEGAPETTADQINAAMELSLGPIRDRPERADLRVELMNLLSVPAQLTLDAHGNEILIQGDTRPTRHLSPGTPRARVDANGTAAITASWKSARLAISERYDSKRTYSETYALQAADGTLLVVREVQRPGMKALRIQSVYHRN